MRSKQYTYLLTIPLLWLAFALRMWQLAAVPPGWRDDELIETLVIAPKILAGDWQLYYLDASGHEALYHFLRAQLLLPIFETNVITMRFLSVVCGLLAIPWVYVLGSRLFSRPVGFTAALCLTLSFWSLMYSRTGIRHIILPAVVLPAFFFLLVGLGLIPTGRFARWPGRTYWPYLLSGGFMGLAFYTYFASRGVPLIVIAFAGYLALVHWPKFRQEAAGLTLTLLVAGGLALPLVLALRAQDGADARVAELALPIIRAQEGDYTVLQEHLGRTVNMFHSDGDDEWLYNIPFRPLFNPFNAAVFWVGVALALWWSLAPLWGRWRSGQLPDNRALACGFMGLWWLAGLAPSVLSVPAGSLGHTILAQAPIFIFLALPLLLAEKAPAAWQRPVMALFVVLVVGQLAWRDVPDYFVEWPGRGNVRFLYRADIRNIAEYAQTHPDLTDVAITGLLVGPWDREALYIDLAGHELNGRWYDPRRVLFLQPSLVFKGYPVLDNTLFPEAYEPLGEQVGGYELARVHEQWVALNPAEVCFVNGLCAVGWQYDPESGALDVRWQVARELDLPPMPLISNPPPPGVDARPRLAVFAQLLSPAGEFVSGDDGLWVDVVTLRPGDEFVQRHWLVGEGVLHVGLYDPQTGVRVVMDSGRDSWQPEGN